MGAGPGQFDDQRYRLATGVMVIAAATLRLGGNR